MGRQAAGGAPVEELAATHGADAWRLAVVATADPAAATRAALHALVIGAVEGGAAAERAAILALSRSWALSIACAGAAAGPLTTVDDQAVSAFWSLSEPLRSTLWCADELRLPPPDMELVLGSAGHRASGVARGRLRRTACRLRRAGAAPNPACAAAATLLGPVLAGHAAGTKLARLDGHTRECEECARLLGSLRDPAAAVAASLPPAPDLAAAAGRAWREHVGAPNNTLPDHVRRAAAALSRHHRPVAAVLAVVTAGTFGSATSQLAASSQRPDPPAQVAAPPARPPARPPQPPPVTSPQAVIPPLALEAVADPGLWRVVTPELAVVTPAATVPPSPATTPPPIEPAAALIGEPLPAEDRSTTLDLSLPLPIPLPLRVEVGPVCTSINVGPLHLTFPCRR